MSLMTGQHTVARHGAHPAEGSRICRILRLVLLLPLILPASCVGYVTLVPAYSATTVIPELQTRVLLRFYYVWGQESGRYLTVGTPLGSVTVGMTAYNWAHNARTSIYLTPDRKVAVLGPMGDDHLISLDPPRVGETFQVPSNDWTYLGAFDFTGYPAGYGERTLRFVSAQQQAECIPMRSDDRGNDASARNAARERNCPAFQPTK